MKPLYLLALMALVLVAAAVVAALKRADRLGPVPTKARPLMTKREQAMYWRLKEAFPSSVVLAQVAFSALITSPFKHRNRFDRKVADFVLCDPAMRVQVVIELDDGSHKGREVHDAARETLLATAGYKVLRFDNVPDLDPLRARVLALIEPATAKGSTAPKAAEPRL